MYTMIYEKPCEGDGPTGWQRVEDSKDDRLEVLLQWCFDYYVSRSADSRVIFQERLVFYVKDQQVTDKPVWELGLKLFDVDQQQDCSVVFRLASII